MSTSEGDTFLNESVANNEEKGKAIDDGAASRQQANSADKTADKADGTISKEAEEHNCLRKETRCLACPNSHRNFKTLISRTMLKSSETNRARKYEREATVAKLCGLTTFDQLYEVCLMAIKECVPDMADIVLFLRSNPECPLRSLHKVFRTFPDRGIAVTAYDNACIMLPQNIDRSDPFYCLTSINNTKVSCWPLVDRSAFWGLIIMVCNNLSIQQKKMLSYIIDQVTLTCRRLHVAFDLVNKNQILTLCSSLVDSDVTTLQMKINKYLEINTGADSVALLLVNREHREIICQVVSDTVLNPELLYSIDDNFFESVIRQMSPISLPRDKFPCAPEFDRHLPGDIVSVSIIPIFTKTEPFVHIALVLMCFTESDIAVDNDDKQKIYECFQYTMPVITSSLAVINERKLKDRTETMLQVAKKLFSHLDDLSVLLREVMLQARTLTKAERCSVFLLDRENDELVATVFDGREKLNHVSSDGQIRIPATRGIAGYVATTGEALNIEDPYNHPLFYRAMDEATGFKTRNLLCFPIKDETGQIVGIGQLCNKVQTARFLRVDESIAHEFSIYCAIAITHCLMYQKVNNARVRNEVTNELMIYHMQVSDAEVERLTADKVKSIYYYDARIDQFDFLPRSIVESNSARVVLSMLDAMGFIKQYRINTTTLARFVLMVRRGYRDQPYHNWTHAFTVAHHLFTLSVRTEMRTLVSDVEALALFISCLCHDIDHRGTTNSYQVASDSRLASLYSSQGSVMERHHLAQTMSLLNSECCNIFENLDAEEYSQVIDCIQTMILATDLLHHFCILQELLQMARLGYDRQDRRQRHLLVCVIMTACDLSDQTKSWDNVNKVADAVYEEFFAQGDEEKKLCGKTMPTMDREQAYVPALQISFIKDVVLPLFDILQHLLPATEVCYATVQGHLLRWTQVSEARAEGAATAAADNKAEGQAEVEAEGETKSPAEVEAEVRGPAKAEAEVRGPAKAEAEVRGPAKTEAEVRGPAIAEAEVRGPAKTEAEVRGPAKAEAEVRGPAKAENIAKGQDEAENKAECSSEVEHLV